MAPVTPAVAKKQPSLQERIAARQAKRAEVGKEAQIRAACAWTIAKTMLPTAPAAAQKKLASSLLASSTQILKAALRQTAINAHFTRMAETFKEVHKVEMNEFLEDPSVLSKEKSAVKSELKGDAKSAAAKTADDREAAGPQPAKYDEGARKEPKDMDAENAGKREAETVDKTEGGETIKDAVQDSAREKNAAAKKAGHEKGCKCAECEKTAKESSTEKDAAAEKEANIGSDGKHNEGTVLQTRSQTAAAKKADDMIPGAPEGDTTGAMPGEGPAPEAEAMPPAEGEAPAGEAGAEGLVQDDAIENVKEKVEETAQAVQQLEQELTSETNEEIDLTGIGEASLGEGEPAGEGSELEMQDIFSDENMAEKASSLANEHHESADDDFFGPSASSDLEASLEEPQFAGFDEMFSHSASADPLAALFEDVKTAAKVEGFEVVNSFADAANHFKSEHGKDDRDKESDHSEDILSLLTDGLPEQSDDQERVEQDATPKLETPGEKKAAAKPEAAKAAAVKKPVLKHIKTSAAAPKAEEVNIADTLFASIDAAEDAKNAGYARR